MERKGQGAIEYLLIIGAAILVVAIVIIAVTGVLGTTNDRGEDASADQLKAMNIQRCQVDCSVIIDSTINNVCETAINSTVIKPGSCAAIAPNDCTYNPSVTSDSCVAK